VRAPRRCQVDAVDRADRVGRVDRFDHEVPMTTAKSPAVRHEPVLAPPAEVLASYHAKVLDPTTAMVVAGQRPIRPTV
jgi:hypothetical protein